MKTLVISEQFSEMSIGGIERYIKNLMAYSVQKNKDVIFVLPAEKEDSFEQRGSVQIHKKTFLHFNRRRANGKKQGTENELREKSLAFFTFIKTLLDEQGVDIVDAENFCVDLPPSYNLLLHMACFAKKIPLVMRAHSFPTTEIQEALGSDLFWEKIMCVSKSVAGDFFSKGTAIAKLDTHYLGVDTREFKPEKVNPELLRRLELPERAKVILHASRITTDEKDILKEKGIIALLEAFSQLSAKNEEFVLLLAIARAPKKFEEEFMAALDKLKGYIQLNNLTGRVICKEFRLEEMPQVYNLADLFVMASENETFGQVYIEAMACGTPVIGTNVGGIPEVITDNYDGFLVEPSNPSVLMQKMEKLLYDENTRKEFIQNGLKTVRRKFSTERQFMLLFNKFEKIVSLHKVS